METRERTRFDERGLIVTKPDGSERALPFYAGAMHYWRVEPARWAACLRQMHALGLTCVETYVPWRVHEVEDGLSSGRPGRFEWSGIADLSRFLRLAQEAGLSVVLRPGPHVNAELTCFGLPDHVVADVQCQARTARGTPVWLPSPPRAWPAPSCASAKFRDRVKRWFAAVGEVVAPFLAPDGPVVALGIDNEAQMFFRTGAFDHDYHPDAIAWWNEASGLDGDPPRAWSSSPGDAARCIAWVRFKDQYIARALGEFSKYADAAGLAGIARFHNLPPGPHAHYDLRRIQHAISGPVGIDAYTARADFPALRRRALACTGNASPIPIAFEVGIGFFPWFPPLGSDDPSDKDRERDHLLTLLAGGIRGFNLFMAVERDRYYGAAISQDAVLESHAKWIAPLISTLAELDWPALRRRASIAVVDTRADTRFGIATSLIDPMTPILVEALGISSAEFGTDASAIAAARWHTALTSALELAQVPYAIVDEATPEDELAQYRAVIVPTIDRIDRALFRRLATLAESKRTIVVIGPNTPTRDELDQPLTDTPPRRIGKLKAGSLENLRGLADDLSALAGDVPDTWQIERPDTARCHVFTNAALVARAVFVFSDSDKPTTAVLLADAKRLRDPFTNDSIKVTDGRAQIPLAPRGVRLLVVD